MIKVHPPALEDWEPYIKSMYEQGCRHIDECLKYVDDDGVLSIPFLCYLCNKMKDNYSFSTGDKCPICLDCFPPLVDIEEKVPHG